MKYIPSALLALMLVTGTALAGQPYPATVVKVDPGTGKVTLKHGAIKKLDMDAMTMGYPVADKGMLAGLKPGDRVTFDVDGTADAPTVTKIEKAK